jgi:hypothetical protein
VNGQRFEVTLPWHSPGATPPPRTLHEDGHGVNFRSEAFYKTTVTMDKGQNNFNENGRVSGLLPYGYALIEYKHLKSFQGALSVDSLFLNYFMSSEKA